MYNQDELFAEIAREEREADARWEARFEGKGYHTYFSTDLDGEVMRCDNCGMNVLGQFSKCADYIAYNEERNRKFRERMGLVTNS